MLDSSPAAATPELPPSSTARPRTVGRPFEKGHSGNPRGRSKTVDVGALCRKHARIAVRTLVRELNGSDPQAAVRAAEVLISHAFGEPVQHHALHLPRVVIECSTGKPEAARTNGEATDSTAWNA